MNVLEAALGAYDAGLCPIPARTDGTKAPTSYGSSNEWKIYQTKRPGRQTVADYFSQPNHRGFGVMGGQVSGHLEMFEVEGRFLEAEGPHALPDAMHRAGLGELWDRIDNGWVEQSPSTGIHWHYRIEPTENTQTPTGNLKLAQAEPNGKTRETLIETKGEGGFTICAPSNGTTHPTGKPWVLLRGSTATIPTITVEEREALHDVARTFDWKPPKTATEPLPPLPARPTQAPTRFVNPDDTRPGDDFNDKTTCHDVLIKAGFHTPKHHDDNQRAGQATSYTRPGKEASHGTSATVWGDGRATIFSSSVDVPHEVDDHRRLDAFQLHTHLNHRGDFSAAASAWARQMVDEMTRGLPSRGDNPTDPPDDTPPPAEGWKFVDLGPFLTDWEPPSPTVLRREDGFSALYPGSVSDIHGDPGSLKSWVAQLGCAQELNAGNHVAYIDFESDPGSIAHRLLALGADQQSIIERFHFMSPDTPVLASSPFDKRIVPTEARNALLDELEAVAPTLVVLDGMTELLAIHGITSVGEEWAALATHLLKPIAAQGPAVLCVDHQRKDATVNDGAIGTIHKRAAITGVSINITSNKPFGKGREGRSTLRIRKDRAGQVIANTSGDSQSPIWGSVVFKSDTDTGTVTATIYPPDQIADDGKGFRPTEAMERVSDRLIDGPDIGMSFRALKSAVGMKEDTVRLAVELMIDEGFVAVDHGGPGKPSIHRSTSPYRWRYDPKNPSREYRT